METNAINYLDVRNVLSEITAAIVGQLDLPELLERIVSLTMRLLHAEECAIFLDDKERYPGRIKMLAGSGFAKRLVDTAEYAIGEGFTGFVAKTGRKFNIKTGEELQSIVDDDSGQPIWKGKYDRYQSNTDTYRFRNLLAVPLKIKNQIIGVIKAENKALADGDCFSVEDERIFEIIANVVALAIENARLHGKVESHLKAISAKAAHRLGNQAANYDGIDFELKDEIDREICSKDNLKRIDDRLTNTTAGLKKMIQDLRSYGRPRELHKTSLSINKIILDEVLHAEPVDGVTIDTENLDPDIPGFLIDSRISESIKELIRNATTAIKNGPEEKGTIKLSTKLDTDASPTQVRIRVEDSGPGFPIGFPIFEPFISTDPQSIGLGLATVKEMVERHGGIICQCSSVLGGACVELTLPVQD